MIKLEAGVRLGDEVPVRHRFEFFVPGGWCTRRGDRRWLGRLTDEAEDAPDRRGFNDEGEDASNLVSAIARYAAAAIRRADVGSGSRACENAEKFRAIGSAHHSPRRANQIRDAALHLAPSSSHLQGARPTVFHRATFSHGLGRFQTFATALWQCRSEGN